MTATATQTQTDRQKTAKLIAPRGEAIKHFGRAVDSGAEIKALRIRSGDDLDEARGHKLQWVADCTDLLNQCFDNTTVADYFNDWVGKVFPEYAEFGNFVEQFYDEMDHRLSKLRAILKRVEDAAEPAPSAMPDDLEPPSGSAEAAAGPAPIVENKPLKAAAIPRAASSPNMETVMPSAASSNKVLFVSHGPKDPSSEAVLQFMQQLSMAVVEADHTNGLIETLEAQKEMGFVVVMNAADQVENGKPQLSDHSVFKLGYCAGKLGIKRMCMMNGPTHPNVGDSQGIAHVSVDPNGGWQLHLARQMRAGCDVDLNRLA